MRSLTVPAAAIFILVSVAHAKKATTPLQTPEQLLASIRNQSLPATSKLQKASTRVDIKWADENTMSGQLCMQSGVLPSAALDRWSKELLATAVRLDDERPLGGQPTVSFPTMKRTIAHQVATTVATEGFCYANNKDLVGPVSADIRSVIRTLGPREDLMLVRTSGKVRLPDSGTKKAWGVTNFTFINKQTGAFASFYSREGWI
jgi:hypothetical protein